MPELPEVETIVRELREQIINSKILDIKVNYEKIIDTHTPEEFKSILKNQTICKINRRAKYIVMQLSNSYFLILHLRMTGKLFIKNCDISTTKHDHIIFIMDNGKQLFYNDTRKFGRFYLTIHKNNILGKLGPEPLGDDFILSEFQIKLSATQRKIKSLLLDQHFLAGLGNIYVDEALWEARIHPEQPAYQISKSSQIALYNSIQNVLEKGIDNKGTSLGDGQGNYSSTENQRGKNQSVLKVFARTGEPCYICASQIKKTVVVQRGTHWCPKCQKIKKILKL